MASNDVEMTTVEAGGAPTEKENPFGKRSRLSMFILLSAIAGAAIIFGAKEQQAEDKVWKQDMKVVKNGTNVADQKPMRYSTVAKMSWAQGVRACRAYGGELCRWNDVCSKGAAATKRLCPDQSCVGLETPAQRTNRLIPIAGRAAGTFVSVQDCTATVVSMQKEVSAVLACCGWIKKDGKPYSKREKDDWAKKHNKYMLNKVQGSMQKFDAKGKPIKTAPPKETMPGMRGIMAIHQAPIIQRAVMKGKISVLPMKPGEGARSKAKVGGASVGVAKPPTGGSKGIWQLQHHMRQNDPFMKAKKTGGKPVQSFHTHIAKHLGNETTASVAKHFNAFTSGMANLVNTIKSNVKLESQNQTAQHGSVTHHLRESDPFIKKGAKGTKEKAKVTSLHKALNTTEMSKHAKAIGDHFKRVVSSITDAASKAVQATKSGSRKTESSEKLKQPGAGKGNKAGVSTSTLGRATSKQSPISSGLAWKKAATEKKLQHSSSGSGGVQKLSPAKGSFSKTGLSRSASSKSIAKPRPGTKAPEKMHLNADNAGN